MAENENENATGVAVTAAIAALGAIHLITAIWIAVAPKNFFDSLATFGVYNSHFLYDVAMFEGGLGIALLASVKWSGLRTGAVAAALATSVLHAINHWFDINAAQPGSHADVIGALSVTLLATVTAWLLYALTRPAA